ncbi:MAG: hypothetical protein PHQ23_16765 [Candidatus Wallbacteria bacterium]|nr:hypothetical protein [Candidatus Wallbacteria bacterium]
MPPKCRGASKAFCAIPFGDEVPMPTLFVALSRNRVFVSTMSPAEASTVPDKVMFPMELILPFSAPAEFLMINPLVPSDESSVAVMSAAESRHVTHMKKMSGRKLRIWMYREETVIGD